MNDHFFNVLLRRRDGVFSTDLLITAIGYLDFFNWLDTHPSDPKGICTHLNLAMRPVDVMLTFFSSLGLIEQVKDTYRVSKRGKMFLVKGSTYDLRGYFNSLRERPICKEILSVLKTNKPMNWANAPQGDEWAKAITQEDFAEHFTSAMDSRGTFLAPVLAKRLHCRKYSRVLDVAGASGVYSSALIKAYPHLHAAILEKPPVDHLAEFAIKKRGLSKDISIIPMDMFSDPWPRGFDMHLFSHVLHDWDIQDVQHLLEKSFGVLEQGGMVVIHDAHINKQKTGPVEVAEYSILLMLSTRGKCYSFGEMERILIGIGFKDIRIVPTSGFRSLITAKKPKSQK
jgi:predicted nicotinamide N-methyase